MKKSRERGEGERRHRGERGLHVHRSEGLLVARGDLFAGPRLLCTTLGRAQFAAVAAVSRPDRRVVCHFLDLFRCEESQRLHGADDPKLRLVCTPDFPDEEFDCAALPLTATGEAELAREKMQAAYVRLVDGGRLVVSTDNPDDSFFHDEMQKLFPKVTRIPETKGVIYAATKPGPLKKEKNFTAEVTFRDGGRLYQLVTRPGVFSHRRVDPGTRGVLDAVTVEPGMKILDLGCGAGPVAIALAGRAENVTVEAVDSNPRAVACTLETAKRNGLEGRVRAHLNAEARCGVKGKLDLAVGNPPYFSKFRIAELFLASAAEALRPGGRVVFVTKQPAWFAQHLPEHFEDVTTTPAKNYVICAARKPR